MKKVRVVALFMAILVSANFLVSCYGSFSLTKKIHKWNGSLGSKWINTVVMWVLLIIPVYEVAGLIDWWVLNTIEFWTGSNPVAMNEGDIEIKTVKKNGDFYEIKATKNRFDVTQITGKEKGKKAALIYNSDEKTWSAESNGKLTKLFKYLMVNNKEQVMVYLPGNDVAVFDIDDNSSIKNMKPVYNFAKK